MQAEDVGFLCESRGCLLRVGTRLQYPVEISDSLFVVARFLRRFGETEKGGCEVSALRILPDEFLKSAGGGYVVVPEGFGSLEGEFLKLAAVGLRRSGNGVDEAGILVDASVGGVDAPKVLVGGDCLLACRPSGDDCAVFFFRLGCALAVVVEQGEVEGCLAGCCGVAFSRYDVAQG